MIYEIPLQTLVITYPEKRSPWEERFEALRWHLEADGLDKTQTSVVSGGEWVGLRGPFREVLQARGA